MLKLISLTLIAALGFTALPVSDTDECKVATTVTVTTTRAYCGGAAPSPEILQSYRTPKPLEGTTFYVKRGSTNQHNTPVIAQATTNAQGLLSLSLKPGTYLITDAQRKDEATFTQWSHDYAQPTQNREAVDMDCLEEWFKTPLLTFEVKKGSAAGSLTFNVHMPCPWNEIPCAHWNGPLPG